MADLDFVQDKDCLRACINISGIDYFFSIHSLSYRNDDFLLIVRSYVSLLESLDCSCNFSTLKEAKAFSNNLALMFASSSRVSEAA